MAVACRNSPLETVTPMTVASTKAHTPAVITALRSLAWRLRFRHPRTQQVLEVEAPLPEQMQTTLAALRQHRRLV